jgi:hypothetical protein
LPFHFIVMVGPAPAHSTPHRHARAARGLDRGRDPSIHAFFHCSGGTMDHRVSPLRGGPVMTTKMIEQGEAP